MSLSVGSKIRNLAADGYLGKQDLQKAAEDMLDGRGVTKTEKERFKSAMDEAIASKDVRVSAEAEKAYDHLLGRMRGYSRTKEAFAPTLDKEEIKDILSLYVDRSRSYSGGESSGSSRTSTPAPSPRRSYSGGE